MNIKNCCPVTIVEDNIMKIGQFAYSVKYNGKYYKFLSMDKFK